MNNKWLKLLLVASVALNVAFILPHLFFYLKHRDAPPREIRTQAPGLHHPSPLSFPNQQELKLRPDQKKMIDAIVKKFKLDLMKYKQEILSKRIEIIDELGNPDFDPELLKTHTKELNILENRLNQLFVNTLVQINDNLDSQQRLSYLYQLSRNWFFINKRDRGYTAGSPSLQSAGTDSKPQGVTND